jgi:hypothetical protein
MKMRLRSKRKFKKLINRFIKRGFYTTDDIEIMIQDVVNMLGVNKYYNKTNSSYITRYYLKWDNKTKQMNVFSKNYVTPKGNKKMKENAFKQQTEEILKKRKK